MGRKPIDHTGETIGSFYLAEKLEQSDKSGHALYRGVCVFCGAELVRVYSVFLALKNLNYGRCKTHFHRHNWENKRLRDIFHDMKRRCYDPRRPNYKNWGGKGIKICDEWLKDPSSFERWAFENGYADNLTIDGIDGNKDYCPENCRWVTRGENASKKSTTIYIEVDGVSLNLKQWSEKIKKMYHTLAHITIDMVLKKPKNAYENCYPSRSPANPIREERQPPLLFYASIAQRQNNRFVSDRLRVQIPLEAPFLIKGNK